MFIKRDRQRGHTIGKGNPCKRVGMGRRPPSRCTFVFPNYKRERRGAPERTDARKPSAHGGAFASAGHDEARGPVRHGGREKVGIGREGIAYQQSVPAFEMIRALGGQPLGAVPRP